MGPTTDWLRVHNGLVDQPGHASAASARLPAQFVGCGQAALERLRDRHLDLLWAALANMFDIDRSASRGLMTARELFVFCRQKLAPYKRIRRLEFSELPKTISGKIRRAELRTAPPGSSREYREEGFTEGT